VSSKLILPLIAEASRCASPGPLPTRAESTSSNDSGAIRPEAADEAGRRISFEEPVQLLRGRLRGMTRPPGIR